VSVPTRDLLDHKYDYRLGIIDDRSLIGDFPLRTGALVSGERGRSGLLRFMNSQIPDEGYDTIAEDRRDPLEMRSTPSLF
jgi:hypothetical protein